MLPRVTSKICEASITDGLEVEPTMTCLADRANNGVRPPQDAPFATMNDVAVDDPVVPKGATPEPRTTTGSIDPFTERSASVGTDIAFATAGTALSLAFSLAVADKLRRTLSEPNGALPPLLPAFMPLPSPAPPTLPALLYFDMVCLNIGDFIESSRWLDHRAITGFGHGTKCQYASPGLVKLLQHGYLKQVLCRDLELGA